MTFLVPNQSLGVLQGILNSAIGGVSPVLATEALGDIQQIPAFRDVSDLRDLTAPQNLARLALNPNLFRSVAQVLKIPPEAGREIYQRETRPERLLPSTPAAPSPTRPTSQATPSAACSMDMVGADLSCTAELPEVDLSSSLSPAEIAHAIFTDIHHLQGKLRISPMEQRIRAYAERLSLSEGVQIYRRTPTAMTRKIFQLMDLAVRIAKVMDDDSQGYFRETMHENHSRQVILDYLHKAKAEGPEEAVPLLERALALYDEVYQGGVELDVLQNVISRALKDELEWPKQVTLETLGPFAVSVRQAFETRGADLAAEQRYQLMRLAVCLDAAAFGLCAFGSEETGTPMQALKMATLIEVLYGCGFGDERWLTVAERLRGIHADWTHLAPGRGAEELGRYAALAAHMLEKVKASYHALFDALARAHGREWGLNEADLRSFTRSLYRTSALFPLGQHLAALHAGNGNRNRMEQILDSLHQGRRNASRPYAPVFLGDGLDEDLLAMGNKGKGLNELTRMGEPVPGGFALPPVLMEDGALLDEDRTTRIEAALTELERRTGRSFADGSLRVSVRSGAAVSMPGTLLTVINVGDRREVLDAVRAVYQSWNNPSAQLYRRVNGVPEDLGTSVIVQEWIETSTEEASGFGLATSDGEAGAPLTRYGRQVAGIDLVTGNHPGRDAMDASVAEELDSRIHRYEDHFQYPVEVEYGVERGRLWILQVRRAQMKYEDEIRWAVGMIHQGRMTREAGVAFLGGRDRLIGALNAVRLNVQGETVLAADAKGGGHPVSGAIALDGTGITALQVAGLQAIFVTDNADAGKSAAFAFEAGAVIFNEGNGVSHLEGDLRASNRPHLGGIPVLVDREAREVTIAGSRLREGDVVTLDPANGVIYRGEIPVQKGESAVAPLIRWLIR